MKIWAHRAPTREERLEHELFHARARYEKALRILMRIHMLLDPTSVKLADGRTFAFSNPHAAETLRELSAHIRAISSELPRPGPMEEIRGRVATALARQLDESIRTAIESRIGPVPDVEELRGRLNRVTHQSSGVETYFLDGAPLLDVCPAEVTQQEP